MDYARAILKLLPGTQWSVGDTYESIQWFDQTHPKPSKADLEAADIDAKADAAASKAAEATAQTEREQIKAIDRDRGTGTIEERLIRCERTITRLIADFYKR